MGCLSFCRGGLWYLEGRILFAQPTSLAFLRSLLGNDAMRKIANEVGAGADQEADEGGKTAA